MCGCMLGRGWGGGGGSNGLGDRGRVTVVQEGGEEEPCHPSQKYGNLY